MFRNSSQPELPPIKPEKRKEHSTPNKKVHFRPFTRVTPLICAFCGGKSCKHENWLTHPTSAIKGLNSDWITDNILATQRPSSRIIAEYKIIEQFKEKGINAILNLQEPGEHPHCGDGIQAQSGFSYLPEEFYDHGIYFFNFGWRDMTATSTDVILKILKQMSFILGNGDKIAVHCHAGRGRTGMVIAAWMIYNDGMSAKEAIKIVRNNRKDSISKKSQEIILYDLEKEIKKLRNVFFGSAKLGLVQYIYNQKMVLPLCATSEEKYVPRIVLTALERLESLLISSTCSAHQVLYAFHNLDMDEIFEEKWGVKHEKQLKTFKERINTGDYQISDIEDTRYLVQIVLDFLDQFTVPAIGKYFLEAVNEKFSGDARLTEAAKDQLFHEVDKKEFFLVESFARIFAAAVGADRTLISQVNHAITRLCISLTLGRIKHDKMFLKRNLLVKKIEDERVNSLQVFIYKWIEYFDQELSASMMMAGSSLRGSQLQDKSVLRYLKSKTLLTKTIQRQATKQSVEYDVNESPRRAFKKMMTKSITNLDSKGGEEGEFNMNKSVMDKVGIKTNRDKTIKLFGANVDSRKNSEAGSEIEEKKEDDDVSFDEKDLFPSLNKNELPNSGNLKAGGLKPLNMKIPLREVLVPTVKKNSSETGITHSTNTNSPRSSVKLVPSKPQVSSIANALVTPRVADLFTSIASLDDHEQDALLQRLLELQQNRIKSFN